MAFINRGGQFDTPSRILIDYVEQSCFVMKCWQNGEKYYNYLTIHYHLSSEIVHAISMANLCHALMLGLWAIVMLIY